MDVLSPPFVSHCNSMLQLASCPLGTVLPPPMCSEIAVVHRIMATAGYDQ